MVTCEPPARHRAARLHPAAPVAAVARRRLLLAAARHARRGVARAVRPVPARGGAGRRAVAARPSAAQRHPRGGALMALYTLALLALAAADGGASDAGLGWNDPLYAQCPQAPPPVPLEDGSWKLPPARAARNACLAETCEARRRTLEPIAAAPPPFSSGSL